MFLPSFTAADVAIFSSFMMLASIALLCVILLRLEKLVANISLMVAEITKKRQEVRAHPMTEKYSVPEIHLLVVIMRALSFLFAVCQSAFMFYHDSCSDRTFETF